MKTQNAERWRCFLGVAWIQVSHLKFVASAEQPDDCFGCCLSDIEHNIPAFIHPADYRKAISESKIDKASLYHIKLHPKLLLPPLLQLPCLHGRYRLENAKSKGDQDQDWFCVDLYSQDTAVKTKRYIRCLYSKHRDPNDGEIYLQYNYYRRRNDEYESNKWLQKLSDSKKKNLKAILRNELLSSVLDELEAYPAIWINFQLGSITHILNPKCYEEYANYLTHMLKTWRSIVGNKTYLCDPATVHCLQGLAPMWSRKDRNTVEALTSTNKIFCRADSDHERSELADRVLMQNGLVLSFVTFFKDEKLVGPAMLNLGELFYPEIITSSIQSKLRSSYSEITQRPQPFEYAYWELCLMAIRDIKDMPSLRREWRNSAKPLGCLVRLAHLAYQLGFESRTIIKLKEEHPDMCDIRKFMREERPEEWFSVTVADFDAEVSRRHKQQAIFTLHDPLPTPPMAIGSSVTSSHENPSLSLFLPIVQDALKKAESNYRLTDFGRTVLILSIFFKGFPAVNNSETDSSQYAFEYSVPTVSQVTALRASGDSNATELGPKKVQRDNVPTDEIVADEIIPDALPSQSFIISPSVYSQIPSHAPYSLGQEGGSTQQPRSRSIIFYMLEQDKSPEQTHTCEATKEAVQQTVDNIQWGRRDVEDLEEQQQKKRKMQPAFQLMDKGALWVVDESQIIEHCVNTLRANSVFYAYDFNSWNKWIKREEAVEMWSKFLGQVATRQASATPEEL